MKTIEFKQSFKVSRGVGCNADLNYWSDGKQCVSCWKPTLKERLSILINGNVWLGVMSGNTQPAVFISGEKSIFKTTSILQRVKWSFDAWCDGVLNLFRARSNDYQ